MHFVPLGVWWDLSIVTGPEAKKGGVVWSCWATTLGEAIIAFSGKTGLISYDGRETPDFTDKEDLLEFKGSMPTA